MEDVKNEDDPLSRYEDYSIFLLGLAPVYLSNQRHSSLVLLFCRFLILVLTLDRHVAATVLTVSLVPRIPPSHSDTWKMALKTYVGP